MYIPVYIYKYVYKHIYPNIYFQYVYIHLTTHVYMCIRIHVCVYTCIYDYMHCGYCGSDSVGKKHGPDLARRPAGHPDAGSSALELQLCQRRASAPQGSLREIHVCISMQLPFYTFLTLWRYLSVYVDVYTCKYIYIYIYVCISVSVHADV